VRRQHPAPGEHLISHYVDMRAPAARRVPARRAGGGGDAHDGPDPGGAAAGPAPRASGVDLPANGTFGAEVGAACWSDFAPKRLTPPAPPRCPRTAAERLRCAGALPRVRRGDARSR
jgi:hypothetical protein